MSASPRPSPRPPGPAPALSAERALHGAAPWRQRRQERAGGCRGAAEGRQPRGGALRGGGAFPPPFPFPLSFFPPYPSAPTPAPSSGAASMVAAGRRGVAPEPLGGGESQRGRRSGPGPAPPAAPQVSDRPTGGGGGDGPGVVMATGAGGGGGAGRGLSGRHPRVSAAFAWGPARPGVGSHIAFPSTPPPPWLLFLNINNKK